MVDVIVVRNTAIANKTAIEFLIAFFGTIIGITLAAWATEGRKRK